MSVSKRPEPEPDEKDDPDESGADPDSPPHKVSSCQWLRRNVVHGELASPRRCPPHIANRSVQPARLELLDPQKRCELGLVIAHFVDEAVRAPSPDKHFDRLAERVLGA
jgi:hypothetical protein